jgi:cephalosporin hydroxylase
VINSKIQSLEQAQAQNPRPARRIRQTHPLNQIRLVQVEKAAADLAEAVREADPAKEEAVTLLMAEVMEAAVKAEVKARRAAARAEKVAVVAETVVGEMAAVKVAAAMANAKKAAPTQNSIEDDDDGEETDDRYQGPYPAAEDK